MAIQGGCTAFTAKASRIQEKETILCQRSLGRSYYLLKGRMIRWRDTADEDATRKEQISRPRAGEYEVLA